MAIMSLIERQELAASAYQQAIVDGTAYSGNKEPGVKQFSASMLGDDILRNFFKFKYGSKESKRFTAATLGSTYQLGIDRIMENNPRYISAARISKVLDNGWTVSGEADQIDLELNVIIDNKVLTASGMKSAIDGNLDDNYNLQLGVYKWLFWNNPEFNAKLNPEFTNLETSLAIVNKGSAASRGDEFNFKFIDTYPMETIESMIVERTNQIQSYIDSDTVPEKCVDVNKYGATKGVPNKCALYCDYKDICPYFDNFLGDKALMTKFL